MKHVAIIGGGIAGPVTALALRRAGMDVTIYDAYPTSADEAGGSLGLAPNGLAALEIVGVAGAVRAAAQPVTRSVMSLAGRTRLELPSLSEVGPMHMVRRADIYRALRDQLVKQGVAVEYGRRLTGVEGTTAIFADGGRAGFDVLVGADGVHSTVRRLIDPHAPGPKWTGMIGVEGVSTYEVPEDAETTVFAFGRRGYYLYWRNTAGGTTWGVNLPYDRPLSLAQAREVPREEWMRTLRETYGDDVPGGDLIRHAPVTSMLVTGALYIMPSVPRWHRDRMVLVGDAAHAPSNSSGQGASLAIESAVQLARCLRDIEDVPRAFATYERLRRSRVEKVAARTAKINHAKTPGPVMRRLIPLLMPLMLKTVMNPDKTVGPEQRYRIDWDAPAAAASPVR
ncbi:FAD-dependent monooxygenase [Microbispora sp. SCL1-1]|uniref:FAD-dependent oxidoreductase n=1 Tax=unclassified Microbispora TaxID=2614687 RepID=UPI00115BBE02|nr:MULTISPECIES: NAD(P)/FAD-dependent oxidoreductase [unclassified Microbispora]NJP23299.1 FAD-dependent monooxygenase [Microbispora sp. CL1-1]TQS16374.1 FAD-dependent monooxygenase [Microbispora sp. SCL1-1]